MKPFLSSHSTNQWPRISCHWDSGSPASMMMLFSISLSLAPALVAYEGKWGSKCPEQHTKSRTAHMLTQLSGNPQRYQALRETILECLIVSNILVPREGGIAGWTGQQVPQQSQGWKVSQGTQNCQSCSFVK